MKGRIIKYSDAELAWIEEHKELPRSELHSKFVTNFQRPEISKDNLKSLCSRRGWNTGRTGQFMSGHSPFNKGLKGYYAPGSEKGWFKKGSLQGRAKQVRKEVGHERKTKDGYLERKVHDGLPMQSRWRAVHLIRWEELNGPVPKGHALKCLDGDKLNTAPTNWELVPRSMLPELAGRHQKIGFDNAEPEVKPALLNKAKLNQRIREIKERTIS